MTKYRGKEVYESIAEAARGYGVHRDTVKKDYIPKEKVKVIRLGRQLFIETDQLGEKSLAGWPKTKRQHLKAGRPVGAGSGGE